MAEESVRGRVESEAGFEAVKPEESKVSSPKTAEVVATSSKAEDYSSKCVFCRIAAKQEPGTELLYCEVGCVRTWRGTGQGPASRRGGPRWVRVRPPGGRPRRCGPEWGRRGVLVLVTHLLLASGVCLQHYCCCAEGWAAGGQCSDKARHLGFCLQVRGIWQKIAFVACRYRRDSSARPRIPTPCASPHCFSVLHSLLLRLRGRTGRKETMVIGKSFIELTEVRQGSGVEPRSNYFLISPRFPLKGKVRTGVVSWDECPFSEH